MTVRIRQAAPALILGAVLGAPLAAAAAAFQNGSFEIPGVGPGSFQDIGSLAQAPTGWVPGGILGNFALFYEGDGTFGVPTQDGPNKVAFGGNGLTGATLSQTFDTIAGKTYTVSFFVTAQQLGSGPQSYSANVFDGQSLLGSDSASIPVALNWVSHSFSFVATSASSTLIFADTSDGGAAASINWALDSVSVSGVPEPSVFAQLGLGLVLLGWLRRGRL